MRIVTVILSAAIVSAAPGLAKDNAQQTAENQVGAAASDSAAQKKICRRPMETGTRMTPRLCLTKEEWKELEELKYRR
ncbi:MAG TPA: hypothetical protein VFT40_11410 [Sphingomicrobium sp.]|jgi:adenosylmethionine-8-amino-7-oxononanoate aminotransferase|nr:hypothetical protein [Sphingomicrobium sp.]